jgi:hypothetical protein
MGIHNFVDFNAEVGQDVSRSHVALIGFCKAAIAVETRAVERRHNEFPGLAVNLRLRAGENRPSISTPRREARCQLD